MEKITKIECSRCKRVWMIDSIQALLIKNCKNCGRTFDHGKLSSTELFHKYYPQGKPKVVPIQCTKCIFWTTYGISFYGSKGNCNLYDEITYAHESCIATSFEKEYGEIKDTVNCPKCGEKQKFTAEFCKDCGTEISPKELVTIAYCEKCKSEFDESYQFCEKDGNQLVLKEKEIDGNTDISTGSPISNNIELKEQVDESLGFGWGNFIMVMAFLQGFSALFLFIADIQNEYVPDRFLAFMLSAICLSGGLGLYQKRKYGLITIYVVQLINAIFGLMVISEGYNYDAYRVLLGVLIVLISIILSLYFKKREAMFT